MAQTMPLRETVSYGKFARREVDEANDVRWQHQLDNLPDVEAAVEKVYGLLPCRWR